MNDLENIACQYVLDSMDIFKEQSLHIQNFLIVEIFPITLDEYPILCSRLVAKYYKPLAMIFIHLMGEELKKRLPDHVSEIEQERVKYLTLTFNNSTSD
jgi:hypothetical protein